MSKIPIPKISLATKTVYKSQISEIDSINIFDSDKT